MIDKKIFKLADQLQMALNDQRGIALKAISEMPEGETRAKLKGLLDRAASGKLSVEDAQKELQNVIGNVG